MATSTRWKTSRLWSTIKQELSKSDTIVVFDLETTGLSRTKDRIIEIAAVKYAIESGYELREIDTYHQFINPNRPLPQEIIDLTGITDEELADKPTEDLLVNEIADFMSGSIISGYNIGTFDIIFLREMFARNGIMFNPVGVVDAIRLARNRLDKPKDVADYKLGTVGGYFGIGFTAHSAIEDTRATGSVLQILLREYVALEAEEASEEPKPEIGSLRPHLTRIQFWAGFRGFSRIYVNFDIGAVYYDIRSCSWGAKDIDIEEVDMPWVENEVYRILGISSEIELGAFKGTVDVA